MGESWKSFWYGAIAAVLIASAAGAILTNTGTSIGEKYSTSSTRL